MFTLEELKKLDEKKLLQEWQEVKDNLFKARFETKSGQAKDNHLIKSYRKQGARIKTLLHAKKSVI